MDPGVSYGALTVRSIQSKEKSSGSGVGAIYLIGSQAQMPSLLKSRAEARAPYEYA
jgi:hypothetical protein